MVVVPETFAGLESLSASGTGEWPGIGVDALVGAYGSRILEPFPALSTLFVHLFAVLEQVVLLQMVALFESDAAQVADKRTFFRMRPHVVPIVRRLKKVLPADGTFPYTGLPRDVRVTSRYKIVLRFLDVWCHLPVNSEMHSHVLLAGERLIAHGTSEGNLSCHRSPLFRRPSMLCCSSQRDQSTFHLSLPVVDETARSRLSAKFNSMQGLYVVHTC